MFLFKDRKDAAERLVEKLQKYTPYHIVIGLPRGGAVMAYLIAVKLNLKWDILIPRKIGSPTNPEFALGAICEDVILIEKEHLQLENITEDELQNQIALENQEAKRRKALYHKTSPPTDLKRQPVILVDDGIATGLTMKASIGALKKMGVKKIIVAVPVAPINTVMELKNIVDEVISLATPESFFAIGQFYESFLPISDEEILQIMEKRK